MIQGAPVTTNVTQCGVCQASDWVIYNVTKVQNVILSVWVDKP